MIILTSVVPRHLPMQTAMAVNTALMALHKAGEQTLLLSIALRLRPLHTDSPRAPD